LICQPIARFWRSRIKSRWQINPTNNAALIPNIGITYSLNNSGLRHDARPGIIKIARFIEHYKRNTGTSIRINDYYIAPRYFAKEIRSRISAFAHAIALSIFL
jgi:hypothetical protein